MQHNPGAREHRLLSHTCNHPYPTHLVKPQVYKSSPPHYRTTRFSPLLACLPVQTSPSSNSSQLKQCAYSLPSSRSRSSLTGVHRTGVSSPTHTHTYICLRIHIEQERERERESSDRPYGVACCGRPTAAPDSFHANSWPPGISKRELVSERERERRARRSARVHRVTCARIYMHTHTHTHKCVYAHTGCARTPDGPHGDRPPRDSDNEKASVGHNASERNNLLSCARPRIPLPFLFFLRRCCYTPPPPPPRALLFFEKRSPFASLSPRELLCRFARAAVYSSLLPSALFSCSVAAASPLYVRGSLRSRRSSPLRVL